MRVITRNMSLARRGVRLFSTTPSNRAQYGFIGLGQMGYQMAKNLQSKLAPSDTVRVFDVNKGSMAKWASEVEASSAQGAKVVLAESAFDSSKDSDVVITVLPEPVHVRGVYESILSDALPRNPERLLIDCSTIDPTTSRGVASLVSKAGQGSFVDAPMSGGVVGATAGTLTFMLGADASLLGRIEPILSLMGKRVLHCGQQGNGLSAKLANNYLLALNNIATAEAMNLGIRCGLDAKVLANVLNVSTGKCWPSEINNPVPGVIEGAPASRDYAGGFGIALMKKDLLLAISAAKEAGARLELAEEARRVYEETAKDKKCEGRDFSVVYRYMDGQGS